MQVRTASCGATACVNTFGDEQLAVDLLADKILFEALKFSVSHAASGVACFSRCVLVMICAAAGCVQVRLLRGGARARRHARRASSCSPSCIQNICSTDDTFVTHACIRMSTWASL